LDQLPRGGAVTVSIGFYARKLQAPAGPNDWCAAKGTTGPQDNTKETLPDIVVKQFKVPILPSTRYIHTRTTRLDATARHSWFDDPDGSHAPPYLPPPGGQQPGRLGALRSITVRQNTVGHPGYVGYAWQAYSSGLLDCSARVPGQLDQMANLSTDDGNGGANAQNGYARSPCGLQGGGTSGVSLAYSLLNDDARNVYLDTSTGHIRPISLGSPPGFAPPSTGLSLGKLNLDSTRLLLHPMGFAVSINNVHHKLETLRMPAKPLTEAQVEKSFLARTASGQGNRPGLMTSPVAAAVSADGVVFVLEDGTVNNRLLAFDVGGNPLPYFKSQKESPYWMRLTATVGHTYLDLAVEFTGYVYVLSQNPDTSTFQLSIYHPSQADTTPICTTLNVNAARLAVDFWRSVYTLNYEVLQLPGGGGFPALTEPSVSLWLPLPP
jgi:hypothetical protein